MKGMEKKASNAEDVILGAIRQIAKPDGVRVHEIRKVLSSPLEAPVIVAALQALQSLGLVKLNEMNGTWRIAGAAGPTPSQRPPAPSVALPKGHGKSQQVSVSLPAVEDTGIPSEVDVDGVVDASQRAVIREAVGARQVVTAGPGFGKTAVACGRVAWLLREGVEPARILLLSFTRTAVREVRARIVELAQGVPEARAVDVRTIDSFAWRLRTGLSERAAEGQGYALNIRDTATMLAAPSAEVREYLDGFDHVVVDEAQDLVGARAALIATLLGTLRTEAGWTVFFDPAQAIYDWSEEAEGVHGNEPSFGDQLARLLPPPARRTLQHLHRTRDPGLRSLLLGARRLVLDSPEEATHVLRAVLEARASGGTVSPSTVCDVIASCGRDPGELLVLVRRRAEVLEVSARLTQAGISHRLRFGGLPQVAAPWIAAVLNRVCLVTGSTRITRTEFASAWVDVEALNPWVTTGWNPETAWRLLRRLGRGDTKTSIKIPLIADRLAGGSLPDDVVRREVGGGGPIVSTIHGSKGRESRNALLFLTHHHDEQADEARVLYVGLSRAKEQLDVHRLSATRWSHLSDSGRPWRKTKNGNLQMEVGRAGDLDLARTVQLAPHTIEAQQATLGAFMGISRPIKVQASEPTGWVRHVVEEDRSVPLAALSRAAEDDLLAIARKSDPKANKPVYVNHLRWFDLGTTGLSPDASMSVSLPEPWNSTRLFLTPVVVGPGIVYGGSK